jgi:two-component system CheB/CheR fusion protein
VGGLTLVQKPETAQFDPMPSSAIDADCADIVAPPDELPARILSYVTQVPDPSIATGDEAKARLASAPLQRIIWLLHERTRHDFSLYKPDTLHRRIERRMVIHAIASLADYADFLKHNPQEIELLFKELLIGVTSFFRDAAVWEYLADVVLPELLARHTTEHKLRAWVVGCSTGEEAYSLAMVFTEAVQRLPRPHHVSLKIFASDLSPDAIAAARHGQYPASITASVSAQRLARFFSAHGTHYQINQNIRDMVIFAQHDVVLDPPFTKLDLISCRNLLIYFDAALQRKLLPLFHYSLRPGGVLLLGSSEAVGKFNHLFTAIESKRRLYLRQDNGTVGGPDFLVKSFPPLSRITKEIPMPPPTKPSQPTDNLQAAADRVMLQQYTPAAVILNSSGDIVYISGHTGKYLEPAAGKANWNFHAMVRDSLRAPIVDALAQVAAQREPLQLHDLRVDVPGGVQIVDVTLQALYEPAALADMTMIVFRDIAPAPVSRRRRKAQTEEEASHAAELQRLQNEIHALREDSRASKEELQSSNEELQSTNEELQSTNEELTTSKEEMQSMNEELQTINTELQTKLDDLALAQSDMQNLLNSIDIAILFLDRNMNVRRYTDRASKIINVRESDVGRPLSDLTSSLQYPTLHEDALETLRTLALCEKQVAAKDGRWFSVRIIPYRRLDDVIDGVVLTFVDITASKALESELRQEPNS